MRDLDELFAALARSDFRRRQRLNRKDAAYLVEKTLPAVLSHAREFVTERLAPASPENDGKQTPWRGHPAFVAQHATATCCRGCLAKWHRIAAGSQLDQKQIDYVVGVIKAWLLRQELPPEPAGTSRSAAESASPLERQRQLFVDE